MPPPRHQASGQDRVCSATVIKLNIRARKRRSMQSIQTASTPMSIQSECSTTWACSDFMRPTSQSLVMRDRDATACVQCRSIERTLRCRAPGSFTRRLLQCVASRDCCHTSAGFQSPLRLVANPKVMLDSLTVARRSYHPCVCPYRKLGSWIPTLVVST